MTKQSNNKPNIVFGKNCPQFLRDLVNEVIPNATKITPTEMNERMVKTITAEQAKTLHLLDVRYSLEVAVTAHGAKVGDVGIGMGQADIAIELEGRHYNLTIREETP